MRENGKLFGRIGRKVTDPDRAAGLPLSLILNKYT